MVQTKLNDKEAKNKEPKEKETKEKELKTAAHEMATQQREISVAEFFEKNRHLLGYDNKRKALLTTIKEAVDNSLDACEEAKILPEIIVEVIDMGNERYRVVVEDNGPGILKEQIPKVFAKLLYGSKFHRLRQSLTGDQNILIKENNSLKLVPISQLVDSHVGNEGDFDCSDLDLEVPCFDWNNYKYSFKKVSHLIKHKRENEIYDIKTAYGKGIKVTGCHSLFTVDKETLKVKEIEARKLSAGDIIIAPKQLNATINKKEINILDYIDEQFAKKRYWHLYTPKETVKQTFSQANIVHLKKGNDRSRKYYRFILRARTIDILDDSYKQYIKKGFLPVWLAKALDLDISQGTIKTYYHGQQHELPLIFPLTADFIRLLALYTAEGHCDSRQIGLTFSKDEKHLVKLVCDAGLNLGINHTIEDRPKKNSIRVKLFGGIVSNLMKNWCGKGAHNKKIPDFIFSCPEELRQEYVDYLHIGDGHKTENRNSLVLGTVSERLANELVYLWLMQGAAATHRCCYKKGLGKTPSKMHIVTIYGDDINRSFYYSTNRKTKTRLSCPTINMLSRWLNKNNTSEILNYVPYLEQMKNSEGLGRLDKSIIQRIFNKEKIGYKIRVMKEQGYLQENNGLYTMTQKTRGLCEETKKLILLLQSDLLFLQITEIQKIDDGYEYVYDLSVPDNENFVGGLGGIACHNSRGQQGIGISAAVMYGQLTTGRAAKITSKIHPSKPAQYFELRLDTTKNQPEIIKEEIAEWKKDHGTRVEIDLEGSYLGGAQSIDQYLKQTAITNPHATIIYTNPKAEQLIFPKATDKLPKESKQIMPHPYGVELGILIKMLSTTEARTIQSFLVNDFSRVSSGTAKEICRNAAILPNTKPKDISREMAEKLMAGIQKTKIISPPTDCLSPIGETLLEKGLRKEINAEFYCATSRQPDVYRGNPFQIEVAIAYGGEQAADKPIEVLRYANRVPLLYLQGACAYVKAITQTNWRPYGLSQSQDSLPVGPCTVVVHMVSVWVPFTSESKEAIAHYPEILKEVKLALQDCGRKLASYIHKKNRIHAEAEKRGYIEKYIPHVAVALKDLLKLSKTDELKIQENLQKLLEEKRGRLAKIGEVINPEFDEEFAKIGKDRKKDEDYADSEQEENNEDETKKAEHDDAENEEDE